MTGSAFVRDLPLPMDLLRWTGPLGARAALITLALALAGCGSAPQDESVSWSPEKLYAEAKDEMASGAYDKAAKLLERLEGRAAGTPLAQQAQIERAYVLWRSGEKAQALTVLERFIKLNPSSPGVDYALYLQGVVNFNDNLGILGNLAAQDLSERDQQASRDSFQSFKQLVDQYPRVDLRRRRADPHELHRQLAGSLRSARGALLLPPRRLHRRREPCSADGAGVPVFALGRGGPGRSWCSSYDRLGLNDLRDDARARAGKNFPNSRFAQPGPVKSPASGPGGRSGEAG
jgi:outer membrane protein assembly factor BamD